MGSGRFSNSHRHRRPGSSCAVHTNSCHMVDEPVPYAAHRPVTTRVFDRRSVRGVRQRDVQCDRLIRAICCDAVLRLQMGHIDGCCGCRVRSLRIQLHSRCCTCSLCAPALSVTHIVTDINTNANYFYDINKVVHTDSVADSYIDVPYNMDRHRKYNSNGNELLVDNCDADGNCD